MKKLLKVLILALVFALMLTMYAVPAMAEGAEATPGTAEFFTWEALATEAGCVAAVLIVVQLFKGVGFIEKIPTRLFAYIIALPVLIAAAYFTGNLTWSVIGLSVMNAAVVSFAANGIFDGARQIKQAVSKGT